LGKFFYRVIPVRKRVAKENLIKALGCDGPESERIVSRMYEHLGVSLVELFRYGTRRGLDLPLRIEGESILYDALSCRRGVLVVTAHLGNWEVLARYGAGLPRPLHIVTQRLSVGFFHEMWAHLRSGGPRLIGVDTAGGKIMRGLQDDEIIGMVLDQHAPERSSAEVAFFGRRASTSTGLVRAARIHGAPVVPIFTWRDGTTHVVSISKPLDLEWTGHKASDVKRATQTCVTAVETAVRAHPEQWLWIHRRWKADSA